MRKTKIICTLGPACRDRKTLTKMIESGMNVARLNMSHQDYDFHAQNISTLKELRKSLSCPLTIMLDTKGPEIRTGLLENGGVNLTNGQKFILTTENIVGNCEKCQISYNRLYLYLKRNDTILIDDGKIRLVVCEISGNDIICTVINGGFLGNTRGVNIPDRDIDMPFLSEKDKNDLLFGIEHGIDTVAASFVRSVGDVAKMREFLDIHGGADIKLFAKIENRSGIENCASILSVADGMMIARGDMGVEIPFEQLPGIQKHLIDLCVKQGKPSITATQMLESMIENPAPTRAEISDVANAVFDSTSAVMLSGETAIGCDPPRVVSVMSSICERAEADIFAKKINRKTVGPEEIQNNTDAVCDAAAKAANHIGAKKLIAVTLNGDTARFMSKYRPEATIIGATHNSKTYHQLALSWGVVPMLTQVQQDTDSLMSHVVERAVESKLLENGDTAIITCGSPVGISGKTNLLKICEI